MRHIASIFFAIDPLNLFPVPPLVLSKESVAFPFFVLLFELSGKFGNFFLGNPYPFSIEKSRNNEYGKEQINS
jgi:hypothetical protein